jgi:hypothetical protein
MFIYLYGDLELSMFSSVAMNKFSTFQIYYLVCFLKKFKTCNFFSNIEGWVFKTLWYIKLRINVSKLSQCSIDVISFWSYKFQCMDLVLSGKIEIQFSRSLPSASDLQFSYIWLTLCTYNVWIKWFVRLFLGQLWMVRSILLNVVEILEFVRCSKSILDCNKI